MLDYRELSINPHHLNRNSDVGSAGDMEAPTGHRIGQYQNLGSGYNPYASRIKGGPRQLNVQQKGAFGDHKSGSFGTEQHNAYANVLETSPLDYTYDYENAGFSSSQYNSLRDIFNPSTRASGMDFTIEDDPDERAISAGGYAEDQNFMASWLPGQDWGTADKHIYEESGTEAQDFLKYVNLFDPYSIAQMLTLIKGGEKGEIGVKDEILGGEVSAFEEDEFARMDKTYYDAIEGQGRETILAQILNNMKQRKTSGFAGSGARDSFVNMQRTGFNESMAGVLSEILAQETEATQNVQKKIDAFRQLLA